jgi:alpha-L-rhamnosidase
MWYVIEAEEYINKRNQNADRELFRKSIESFLNFLEKYENQDGMLEDLPGWNFVEWSDANKWTQNVNYPTNFLYAGALRSAYRLFGDKKLLEKAEKISSVTKKLSFDGTLFTDNAVRINGVLKNTMNTSEACQYYALLFGDVDIDAPEYESLKKFIKNGFSSIPTDGRKFVPVNAFIGLYLRISVLLKLGYYRILIDEAESFFGGMVEKTGTLWEYRQMKGSLDHGFASFVLPAIYEAKKHIES